MFVQTGFGQPHIFWGRVGGNGILWGKEQIWGSCLQAPVALCLDLGDFYACVNVKSLKFTTRAWTSSRQRLTSYRSVPRWRPYLFSRSFWQLTTHITETSVVLKRCGLHHANRVVWWWWWWWWWCYISGCVLPLQDTPLSNIWVSAVRTPRHPQDRRQWWANLNHDLIWRTRIGFRKRVIWIWFEILWFDLKSVLNMRSHRKIEEGQTVHQNCGGTAVQDGEQWLMTASYRLKFRNLKNHLELTIMNVCKTIMIFARFDSYYVNWTFSKNDIVVKLICDLICDLPITDGRL